MIYGTAYDESLGDQLHLTAIATGLSSVARRAEARETRSAPPLMSVVQPPQHTQNTLHQQHAQHAQPAPTTCPS